MIVNVINRNKKVMVQLNLLLNKISQYQHHLYKLPRKSPNTLEQNCNESISQWVGIKINKTVLSLKSLKKYNRDYRYKFNTFASLRTRLQFSCINLEQQKLVTTETSGCMLRNENQSWQKRLL